MSKEFYRVQVEKNDPLTLSFMIEDENGSPLRNAYYKPDAEDILFKINGPNRAKFEAMEACAEALRWLTYVVNGVGKSGESPSVTEQEEANKSAQEALKRLDSLNAGGKE